MKLLVLSDYFYGLIEGQEIDYIRWTEYRPLSLKGYDCLLIDMTFKGKESYPNTVRLLYELKTNFGKPGFLSKNNLVVIVVCGSSETNLKSNGGYDDQAPDEIYREYFGSYDFLKAVIPGERRMEFDQGKHVYPVAQIPVLLYLLRYKSGPTYLCYDFDPDAEECIDIIPLAKMKRRGNACVAFEYRSGRGLVAVLPSYDANDGNIAFQFLLRICKSYFKRSEGIDELIQKYIAEELPQSVRDNFIEGLICFAYDLYTASILMCRRSLEESTIHQGANKFHLRAKIAELESNHLIDSNSKEIAEQIIEFGNWGAHPGIYDNKSITEDDVINVIEFLKIYFNSVYSIPKKLKDGAGRKEELQRKEVK
jgi:hypothetical protein